MAGLIIRNAQMNSLSHYVFDDFVRRTVVHLRDSCPRETQPLDDIALSKLVRAGTRDAERFEIREETNLESFLEYCVRYGMQFYDTTPFRGARGLLESRQMSETEKMNRVNEYLIFRQP